MRKPSGDLLPLGLGCPSMWHDARLSSPHPNTQLSAHQASPYAHTLTCSVIAIAWPGLPSSTAGPSGVGPSDP